MAQPKFKKKIESKVEKPEWPIKVQCDAHGWMHACWISQDHPYYAVTDANGTFKITDLPAGDYEVEVWHEELGKTDAEGDGEGEGRRQSQRADGEEVGARSV